MCNLHSENAIHLLFFCDVSRHIWLASPWNLRTENLICNSLLDGLKFLWHVEALDSSFSSAHVGSRNIFLFAFALFDHIWKNRNVVTHGNPSQDFDRLFASISKSYQSALDSLPSNKTPNLSWSHPPVGWIKLNFDASLVGNRASLACVARNNEGTIIGWTCRRLTAPTPLSAEAMAAKVAIDMACQANWHSIILEGDSKDVLDSLSSRNCSSVWAIFVILDICLYKLAAILVWHAISVPRTRNFLTRNFLAHNIARWGNSFDCNVLLPSVLPRSVCLDTESWLPL
ncbi:hypothetical protein UlMin_005131 [Ulmus minor]